MNYCIKKECADLENKAKTTCNAFNLSFNFLFATSCPVTPYYSSSLSKYKLYESIECADLENKAKTTLKCLYLSFIVFVATSCQVTPYYSSSLSKYELHESLDRRGIRQCRRPACACHDASPSCASKQDLQHEERVRSGSGCTYEAAGAAVCRT